MTRKRSSGWPVPAKKGDQLEIVSTKAMEPARVNVKVGDKVEYLGSTIKQSKWGDWLRKGDLGTVVALHTPEPIACLLHDSDDGEEFWDCPREWATVEFTGKIIAIHPDNENKTWRRV